MKNITKVSVDKNIATFYQKEKELFLLEIYDQNIIRVASPANENIKSPLEITPSSTTEKWVVSEKSGEDAATINLETANVSVTVDKVSGKIQWRSIDSKELLLQQPAAKLTPQPVVRYRADQSSIKKIKTVDGERNFVERLEEYKDRDAFRCKVLFDWQQDETIHGLGQAEDGIWNLRGQVQYLYQHNMRIPVPFLMSGNGYGVLFDCGGLMTFNDDARGSYVFLDTVDRLDYYFIAGESPDKIVAGFRRLCGQAVLPPKWAFGYIQSKEAYRTQEELVEIAREYRRRRIPLDCVVQDWSTWEKGKWGNKRVDKERFPDIAEMRKQLHGMNVHSMISVWPNMDSSGEDHAEMDQAGALLADQSTYNAFDQAARDLYWQQAAKGLYIGFDSWWCDSTEPFSGPDWGGSVLREPWERYSLVGGEHKKFLDAAYANIFALAHSKGIYEGQRAQDPDHRVLNLTRSGSAGSQKYGTVLWSGDVTATWDTLRKQITEGLQVSVSGLPWWTLDIGGFFTVQENWQGRGCGNNKNPEPLWFWEGDFEQGVDDLGYRELYVRWLQLGVFLPMFRSHGTDTPREIWRFGEPGTQWYDSIEKYIRLRYKLMPTVYSLAGRVALEDYTMLRALIFDFYDDPVACSISDQFMFGDSLLVCPIVEPFEYGPNSEKLGKDAVRKCYLPSGFDWFDYWSEEEYKGGQWVDVKAPLDTLPLFVRTGSIIVSETDNLDYACQQTDVPLEIRVWQGADATFNLYEDAGDGYGYQSGEYNSVEINWDEKQRKLSIGAAKHDFPQSIRGRICSLMVGSLGQTIKYTGEKVEVLFG